jgi:hypothetical protein
VLPSVNPQRPFKLGLWIVAINAVGNIMKDDTESI